MPNPKGKTSKSKKGARRSHHKAVPLGFAKCSSCGELKLNHVICPKCGKYADKQIKEAQEI